MTTDKSHGNFNTSIGDSSIERKQSLPDASLIGEYKIIRLLGLGGMGEVYEAEHLTLRKRYALKVLPEDFAATQGAVERFKREAKVMANLEHPNIIKVDDFGNTDGRYWIRMELVHGVDVAGKSATSLAELADLCGGKIEQFHFTHILRQILGAMAYAHSQGVVHRDLKPSNILLEKVQSGKDMGQKNGEHDAAPIASTAGLLIGDRQLASEDYIVKVSDFGLVRLVSEDRVRSQVEESVKRTTPMEDTAIESSDSKSSFSKSLIGTYEYMSPEQKKGKEAGKASDVYAIGLICYRLLTGKYMSPRPPSYYVKDLFEDLDDFILKALEEHPAERFADASEMLSAFSSIYKRLSKVEHINRGERELRKRADEERRKLDEAERRLREEAREKTYGRKEVKQDNRGTISHNEQQDRQTKTLFDGSVIPLMVGYLRQSAGKILKILAGVVVVMALLLVALAVFEIYIENKESVNTGIEPQITVTNKGKQTDGHTPKAEEKLKGEVLRQVSNQQLNPIPVSANDWIIPDIGMELLWIKALDCWVGKYEVTNGEYRKLKPEHNSKEWKGKSLNDDRQPVVLVNFDDASEYAKWLTERERKAGRIPAGYCYRLPSEKEWTTFCQCGDSREYPWGNEMLAKYGNYNGQEGAGDWYKISNYNDGFTVTCPVEKSGKNDWSMYGVGGNVWELTVKSSTDLSFDALRGSSWSGYGGLVGMRSTYRLNNDAPNRDPSCGFRLVLYAPVVEQPGRDAKASDEKFKISDFVGDYDVLASNGFKVILTINGDNTAKTSEGYSGKIKIEGNELIFTMTTGWCVRINLVKGVDILTGKSISPDKQEFQLALTKKYVTAKTRTEERTIASGIQPKLKPENDYLIVNLSSHNLTYSDSAPPDLLTKDIYKTDKVVMHRIPAGSFIMGSPSSEKARNNETPYKVNLTKDFYIGVFEVTQGQWEKMMKTPPPGTNDVKKDAPVEQVSWIDCQNFIKELNGKKSSPLEFRLPTEAEWEYACRGGNISKGFEYSGSNNLDEVGWFQGNSVDIRHPVGKKKPNELGLYDMSGNVWEWCSDWLGDYTKGDKKDPQGAKSGLARVIRGGCYSAVDQCRAAYRHSFAPTGRSCAIGFRLAMDIPVAEVKHNTGANQPITVFTAGPNIKNLKTIISGIDKDIEINSLPLDTETLKNLKEQCKGKILVVLNNGLADTNKLVFNKVALEGLSKFVAEGGCLVIFEQYWVANTALLDDLFKIKVEFALGKGIIVEHKEIKGKLDRGATSELIYEDINFYNKYDAPEAKTILTTKDHKTKIGIIVPFNKGTVVLMGITLDQNPSLNLLNAAVFDYLINASLDKSVAAQKEIKAVSEKSDNGSVVKQNMDAINNATIYVICDNAFTFCVNGKEICFSDGSKEADLVITKASIKKGDVITVKCVDFGWTYGFACVVRFKDNKNIVSDTKNWKSYTPRNNDSWFDVNGIQNERPAMFASNRDWKNSILKEANVDCDSIWGERRRTCYLVYEVKDEFNMELSVQGNQESAQPTQKDIDRLNPEKSVASVDIDNSSSGKGDVQLINLEPEIARVGWASMVNGKDIKGDKDTNAGCRPTVNNQLVKEDFIYTPSSSHVRYSIPSGIKYFSATMGSINSKPDVVFKIIVDRKILFESKMVEWEKNALDLAVELPPSPKNLDLIIEQRCGGNATPTFWAFPKFLKSRPEKLTVLYNIEPNPPPVRYKAMECDGKSVALINLKPEMARVGWGSLIIGKDIKKDKDTNANCRPFIDNDYVLEDFLYAPCPSQLQYAIPGGMKFFSATLHSKNCGSTF